MPRKGTQKPMITRLPITKARVNFGAVVKRVHLNKEYVIIEKDGIPIAGLMDIDEFEDYLEQQDPSVQSAIEASDTEYREGKSRAATELLSELADPKQTKSKKAKRNSTL
jgi:PHD/YefM family antitoxin component YafN of YafNO toxin-antitoxin module